MKAKYKLILIGWLGAMLLAAFTSGAQTAAKFVTAPVSPATNTYLVALRPQADQDRCAKDFSIQRHHSYRHALNGFSAVMDAATAEKLKHDPRVLAMGPDSSFTICQAVEPSHIIRMGLTNFPVWQHNPINVNIAIMDTGIQTNHPDLNVVNWTSVVGGDGSDWEGHGTMVAGLAGALGALVDNVNNAIVVGVAPGAKLWSVQIAIPGGPTGASGSWADFLAGLDYIATNADQIEVINASIAGLAGDTGTYDVVDLAVSNICSMGIVFVCAAGNNGSDILGLGGTNRSPDDFLPAALPSAMTVSAMDAHPSDTGAEAYENGFAYDNIAGFSNFSRYPKSPNYVLSPGMGIDVCAPGVSPVTTTMNSGYTTMYNQDIGTSFASPCVAGMVALYIAANGRAHSFQDVIKIRQAIVNSSQQQTEWNPALGSVNDPDDNPEPLVYASAAWAPTITGGVICSNGFQISFPSIAETNSLGMPESLTDAVQYADSLDFNQPWDTLTVTNGMGAMVTVTDTNPATSRFYRLARNGPAQTVSIWYTSRGDGLQHWFTETNVTEDGIQAFEVDLEPIPDPGNHYGQSFGDRSCLTEYVNGPGLVTFWWQAESCDITFSIGGLGIYQVQGQISGMQPWQEQTFQIPAGPQTLEWVAFSPDNLAVSAWVSAVTFTNTSPPTGSQP